MASFVYSPSDSRGWGIGNYLIGGALQPSDIYTVRVREHWRRKRRRATVSVQVPATPAVVVAPPRRRRRASVPPSTRVLRSAVTPVVPAPAVAVPAPATISGVKRPTGIPVLLPTKRRRLG
ncbi:pVII [psittacine adenovirus 6]|uniref:PVII n=1 Tax=psittacine adenovirus 6 TaxID=3071234 RepID=A0AAE7C176_9ADEN|nr:pVII [psittacine adenovirus 6]